jgi:hypothetical protein
VASQFLGMGIIIILACFHCEESLPEVIDRLKSLVTIGVMEVAVYFNIFAEIPSGPLALVTSNEERK